MKKIFTTLAIIAILTAQGQTSLTCGKNVIKKILAPLACHTLMNLPFQITKVQCKDYIYNVRMEIV